VLTGERNWALAAAVAMLLAAVLMFQAGTDRLAPTGTSDITGRSIGRAGFAYLTGIRTYAAAVLWNRLDPIGDTYYGDKTLTQQTFVLPTLHIVQVLDPQFTQAYYVSAWIIFARGDRRGGLANARDGVRNNPRSGLMITQLTQFLLLMRTDGPQYLPEAVKWADRGREKDVVWTDSEEKVEGYGQFRVIYERTGQTEKVLQVEAVLRQLEAGGADNSGAPKRPLGQVGK
jgi:hypothetical protein